MQICHLVNASFAQDDDRACGVQTSPPCSARHLNIFTWKYGSKNSSSEMKEHNRCSLRWKRGKTDRKHQTWEQISEAGTVVFPDAVKHHSSGRHVYSHCKCLSGKQHLGDEGKRQEDSFNHHVFADHGWSSRYYRYVCNKTSLTLTSPREKSISITSFSIGRIPLWWTAMPLFNRSLMSKI